MPRRPLAHPARGEARPARARLALAAALTLGLAPPARAQEPPAPPPPTLPRILATRAEGPIVLDGVPDEPPWRSALRLAGFVQQVPRAGEPASETTQVRILYDDRTLYLAIVCSDAQPDRILARTLARDDFALLADDLFAVAIDPGLTRRDGFWFAVNPAGAHFDAQIFNEGRIFDTAWDGVWEARARRGPGGWSAEMRIPLSNLRFEGSPEAAMGFNFHRLIRRRNEEVYLPAIPRDYGDEAALSRALPVWFENVSGGAAVQVKPHALVEHRRAAGPGGDTDDLGSAGLDLKWGITPTLTADFTLDTDFAETEVDQQQINLTRFGLFFPEKRDFFLENAGLFQFGLPGETQIFFSRRIGLEGGLPVPIRAGGRLSGRAGRLTLGLLDVLQRDTPDLERTNFAVLRARHDLGRRGSAGFILTDRRARDSANRVAGVDLLWPFKSEYRVEGFLADSFTSAGGASATAADGDGRAAYLRAAREGDLWQYSIDYTRVDPDFTAATGFVQRPDMRRRRASLAWRPRPASSPVRQWRLLYSPTYLTDSDDRLMTRLHFAQAEAELHSGDTLGAFFLEDFERLVAPFEIVPGVVIPTGDYDNHEAQATLTTSGNRVWAGSAFANLGDFFGGRRRILGASLTARAGRHLSVGIELTDNRVRLPAGEFGTRLGLVRVRYAFTPRLFGGVLMQSNSLTDEIGLNLRLNWIHSPGADLFFVYNRLIRPPDASFLAPDAERDTTILKITHLWRF